jgi:hypothetical protein
MARTTTPPRVEADPNLHLEPLRPPQVLAIPADRRLHGERRIARPHRMIFMGDRRAKQRHNPIAHDLVHGAFIAMHGRHHAFQHRVENRPGVFGVALGQQLHRAFEVGEQHGHLLALAFEGGAGGEDLVGQVWWRVGERRLRMWCKGCGHGGERLAGERGPTFATKRKPRRILKATVRAASAQYCPAATTKIHPFWIRKTTARAVHRRPLILLVNTRYIKQAGQTIASNAARFPTSF